MYGLEDRDVTLAKKTLLQGLYVYSSHVPQLGMLCLRYGSKYFFSKQL